MVCHNPPPSPPHTLTVLRIPTTGEPELDILEQPPRGGVPDPKAHWPGLSSADYSVRGFTIGNPANPEFNGYWEFLQTEKNNAHLPLNDNYLDTRGNVFLCRGAIGGFWGDVPDDWERCPELVVFLEVMKAGDWRRLDVFLELMDSDEWTRIGGGSVERLRQLLEDGEGDSIEAGK